ncbi:Tripartite motif-containing protein 16 [Anabarilius grahami]|uniref:Tripartite motif-containing protein 16 n=1 Tax=Anabarilius grahami TaxID=495550 RepID=A0A3N0XSD4_ANAGA|nr:Tripartite motif-containing protein 16 [Anabarilius grahami]
MAEARFSQDEFMCPVCLDLLKDPVTTSCGHGYCKSCITDCWDQEDQKRVYSCPQSKQTFSPRPALAENTILAEVVEKLKKRKRSADCYAGAGDVQCDVCTGRKHKAVKSCLACLDKMAEARFSQDEFMCPVCLDLLKDPVTTSCGHGYCKSCITDCWDQEDQKRVYSCPQSKQTFSPRPALAENTILAEVVEKLKKRKRSADCYAGAGDVQCDVCTGRKHKAVKSCLEMICQKHDKILEVFCRTDQKCICVLCTMDEHKNHDTVSTAAQRTEKQHHLKETQRSFQQRIQQREKDLQQLREAVESHKRSAQTAVEDSERIFTELIRSIERSRSEATQWIRDQEKTAVSQAEGRLERLEQEINDLRRKDAELEQLSHTQDHIHFLQSFQSLSAPAESTDVNDDPFSSLSSFDGVRESVLQLRDKLEDFCKEELKKISDRVTFTKIDPRTRNDFLQYSHQFTLDLNTVNKLLRLSERNRVITYTNTELQPYPDHPDRFDYCIQVLCRESVSDRRCYWEIEWSGAGVFGVFISVSYKSISRKGGDYEGWFGYNDQSWSLICSSSSYSFIHNRIETKLPVESISRRIGVYVDHSAGTLSFYSVSGDTMILIHTVQTTFTQPLYPGFTVEYGSSVKLC